ncbi:hypothetical protein, partial [Streptomyces hydrogenans]|uniref:hypothetical protein n=1 Tax=Streptomyces hydrogenans TaxID=1873719 RepID=UPI0035D6A9DA
MSSREVSMQRMKICCKPCAMTSDFALMSPSLDRVLCGEADEPLVAAEGGGESEKGQVVAGV